MTAIDPVRLDAWKGLLFSHARVLRALEADMVERHGLPLTWFDVLGRLNESPDKRLRMFELERASVFTRSGMTRLVDKIEAAGLVRRERTATDRRGVVVVITTDGARAIQRIWPDHAAALHDYFGRHVTTEEARVLSRVARRLLEIEN